MTMNNLGPFPSATAMLQALRTTIRFAWLVGREWGGFRHPPGYDESD
jgi:hypothetical protein